MMHIQHVWSIWQRLGSYLSVLPFLSMWPAWCEIVFSHISAHCMSYLYHHEFNCSWAWIYFIQIDQCIMPYIKYTSMYIMYIVLLGTYMNFVVNIVVCMLYDKYSIWFAILNCIWWCIIMLFIWTFTIGIIFVLTSSYQKIF